MQCPGLINAYIKPYTRKKAQASTKEESNVTNNYNLSKKKLHLSSDAYVGNVGAHRWSVFWVASIGIHSLCKVSISASNGMSFIAFSAILRCMGCRYFNLFPHTVAMVKYSSSASFRPIHTYHTVPLPF
jgi:hypothetical protein